MRLFGNAIQNYYGALAITLPPGTSWGIGAAAANSSLLDLAGNANVLGTSSLAIGQSGAGVSTILARGAQQLQIGVNAGNQINISSAGAITLATAVSCSSTLGVTGGITSAGLTVTANGASITGPIAMNGAITITDTTGSVWGAATGGAKGSGTINATGLFINGVAVPTTGGATIGVIVIAFNGGSAPTITSSKNLGVSPTVTRSAPGTYTVNHNMALATAPGLSLTMNNGGASIFIPQSVPSSGNSFSMTTQAVGSGLADPANTYVVSVIITTG